MKRINRCDCNCTFISNNSISIKQTDGNKQYVNNKDGDDVDYNGYYYGRKRFKKQRMIEEDDLEMNSAGFLLSETFSQTERRIEREERGWNTKSKNDIENEENYRKY